MNSFSQEIRNDSLNFVGNLSQMASGLTLMLALVLLQGCVIQPVQTPVPASLVPIGERQVDRLESRGMQTYECRAKAGATSGAEWVYVAAETDLIDGQGKRIGNHTFPPPLWQALDGSKLIGTIKANSKAPQAGAASWLLVTTRSTGGEGRFSKITSLQRVNTQGGIAPTRLCDGTTIGAKERVAFTSDFVLFSK